MDEPNKEKITAGWYWIGGWVHFLTSDAAKRSMKMYPGCVRLATPEELENWGTK